MRKALIGLILAATAITPIAAEAQRGHRGDGERGGSTSRSSSGHNAESRAARIEARNEARQARSESAPQQQQQQQEQAQPQQQQRVVQRQHGGDGGGNRNNWRGNDNNQANNNRGNRGGGGDDGRRGRNNQSSIYPQAWQGNPNDPRLRHYQQLERRNQQQGYRRGDNRGNDGRNWRNNRGDNDARRGDRRRGDWNRGWRSDRRYDWNGWRRGNRHRFHLSPYYSPYRDWNYSRFSIGFFLEPLFYNQRYWIGDPWQYRLPPAPDGTQWVRYYNDVLLVDIYTGEVVDTIYDFFW